MKRLLSVSTIVIIACALYSDTYVAAAQVPALQTNTLTSLSIAQPNLSSEIEPDLGETDHFGSVNVPMDSWIYSALERLAALGYIPTQSVLIRPWTRNECLRQVEQAQQLLQTAGADDGGATEGRRVLTDLSRELKDQPGNSTAVLESVYARYGVIAGPALTDGYHFGQTWCNDFGRPLGRGGSAIAGFSIRATHGRFFLYDRQELQQSPGSLAISSAQSQFIGTLDNSSFYPPLVPNFYPPASATAAYTRQRPIELYAGVAFHGTALSFGKQQLYWGPTTMGPLSFSSNAEPTYNLQWAATRPHPYPFLPQLGSYRFDFVFGKLSGHRYPARPYYNGAKIDLTFGHNFEVSFTR